MVLIFKSWPLLNTMTTYAILWTASDITQELVVSRKKHVDWNKTARITTTGAFVTGPLVYTWLHIAEHLFPGKAVATVLKKVVVEQLCFAPIGICSFYIATGFLEGRRDLTELKQKFRRTYQTGLTFWPFVQIVNFRFVPHHYKPVTVACASYIWSIFLCYMKEPEGDKVEKQEHGALRT